MIRVSACIVSIETSFRSRRVRRSRASLIRDFSMLLLLDGDINYVKVNKPVKTKYLTSRW